MIDLVVFHFELYFNTFNDKKHVEYSQLFL